MALLAVALAGIALMRPQVTEPTGPAVADSGPSELRSLAARLSALEARPLPRVADTATERPRTSIASPDPTAALATLETRVGVLERRLQDLVAKSPPDGNAPIPTRSPQQIEQERLTAIATSTTSILDPRVAEKAKLQAWAILRRAGPDAWTDAVIDEMVRIGLGSTDPAVRADVWRQADGNTRNPRIVPAMLRALATDPFPSAREEAAETLAEYREEAGVRAALEFAARGDDNSKVREQSRKSLEAH